MSIAQDLVDKEPDFVKAVCEYASIAQLHWERARREGILPSNPPPMTSEENLSLDLPGWGAPERAAAAKKALHNFSDAVVAAVFGERAVENAKDLSCQRPECHPPAGYTGGHPEWAHRDFVASPPSARRLDYERIQARGLMAPAFEVMTDEQVYGWLLKIRSECSAILDAVLGECLKRRDRLTKAQVEEVAVVLGQSGGETEQEARARIAWRRDVMTRIRKKNGLANGDS